MSCAYICICITCRCTGGPVLHLAVIILNVQYLFVGCQHVIITLPNQGYRFEKSSCNVLCSSYNCDFHSHINYSNGQNFIWCAFDVLNQWNCPLMFIRQHCTVNFVRVPLVKLSVGCGRICWPQPHPTPLVWTGTPVVSHNRPTSVLDFTNALQTEWEQNPAAIFQLLGF